MTQRAAGSPRPRQASPSLRGRRVVLGVCGSIAAYKAVELCRGLQAAGAEVTPVLTRSAQRFVGRATFAGLASHPPPPGLWGEPERVRHTELGRWAEVVVVAPATANLLAVYRAGMAGDLMSATLLATRAPVVVAPAMHTEMWEHPATQENVAVLRERGVGVVAPVVGPLAGGDVGGGRMASAWEIAEWVAAALSTRDLHGRQVLVTAGGTREPIDAVRFLANRSTGRQGHALAAEAWVRGADVTLVTAADHLGLDGLEVPAGVEVVQVETAAEMAAEVSSRSPRSDVVIMAAAVADFATGQVQPGKLHRADGPVGVTLDPTEDIIAGVSARRRPGQVLVGFAAEVGDPRSPAAAKLRTKGLDLVVANDVSAAGSGFGHPTNQVTIISAGQTTREVGLGPKREVAAAVLEDVARLLATR